MHVHSERPRSLRSMTTVALTFALAGCAGRLTVRPDPRARAPLPDGAPATSRITLDEAVPTIAPLPGLAGMTGTRAMVTGRRAERSDGTWRFSEQVILGEVILSAEVGRRWLFATRGGSVFASDTFLGPLRRIGEVPARDGRWSPWSRDRVAFAAGRQLWTSDGVTVSGPIDLLAEVEVAVFRDASVGVAALADGRAMLTRDCGARWEPLEVGHDAVIDTAFDGRALTIDTVGEHLVLDDALQATRRSVNATAVWEAPWDPAVERELARAWNHAFGRGSCQPAVRLGDGTCVGSPLRWRSHDRDGWSPYDPRLQPTVFRPEEDEGRLLPTRFPTQPMPWGPVVALVGEGLFRTDGATVVPVPPPRVEGTLPMQDRDFVASDDGVHAAMRWPCAATSGEELRDGYCALLDVHGGWRDLAASDEFRWELVGMHAELLLLRHRGDDRVQARVVSVETGQEQEIAFAPSLGDVMDFELGWLPDGSLVGIGWRNASPLLLRGRPGAPLSGRPLPDGAQGVTFADARRGYAWGAVLDALWRTEDGGEHWSRLPVPAAGGQALQTSQLAGTTCKTERCVAGPWAIEGWGPVASEVPYVFGDRARPLAAVTNEVLSAPLDLRCTRGEPRGPSILHEPVAVEDLDGAPRGFPSEMAERSRRFTWRFVGQRRGPLAVPVSTVFAASSHGLLLRTENPPGLDWMTLDGRRRRVTLPSSIDLWQRSSVLHFVPLPDGGLVALLVGAARRLHDGFGRTPWQAVAMIHVDATGTVVASRAVQPRYESDAGLARHRGRWGVALRHGRGAASFVGLEGERYASEVLASLPERGPRLPPACSSPADEDDSIVRFGGQPLNVQADGDQGEWWTGRAELALRHGVWCTRRVSLESRADPLNVEHVDPERARVSARGGTLLGEIVRDGERRALRCEVGL